MLIKGFGFSGYRSVGDEIVKISPLKKINLIIGKNNSGKSNIIYYLKDHFSLLVDRLRGQTQTTLKFTDIDRHISDVSTISRIAFPLETTGVDFENHIDRILGDRVNDHLKHMLEKIIKSDQFLHEDGYSWFIFESSTLSGKYQLKVKVSHLKDILNPNDWQKLWNAITRQNGGGLEQHWIPETIQKLPLIPSEIPPIEFIPAIRRIGEAGTRPDDYSGIGIIERLARLQNPPINQQGLKIKFDEINNFVRSVLENEQATLEIPYDRDMILVHMDNKTLPLSSLGTGIHEVIILASASTVLDKSVLCVEEPELHIHPLLQRKLIQYLSNKTTNQYFFTTHSAHLLDTDGAEVFHVKYNNGKTTVDTITTTKDKSDICHALGYKASDLLQSNCIIWVEGPSDRIYINNWLKSVNGYLVEGVHYSVMFFGGRLFSHLTADDENIEKIEDFISLRKLNRNICIVFDSDKESPKAHLNATKERLKQEFNKGPGFAWVTKGREIENYIPPDIIEKCVNAVHPSSDGIDSKNQWANVLKYKIKRTNAKKTANKVKVARHYVDNYTPDFSILDLKARIEDLNKFIRVSNGLSKLGS